MTSYLKTYVSSIFRKLLILSFSFFLLQVSFAQNTKKTQLQTQYQQIQAEIKKIESLLKTTQVEKNNSLNQLQAIKSKIQVRQNLISNINEQVTYLKNAIEEKQVIINSLKKEIEKLKADYAVMIQNAYKNKYNTNPLNFIFSSESFNQAFQRFTYMRTYAKTRDNQALLIEKNMADLQLKIAKLEADKAEKEAFLGEELVQRAILEKEEQEKNTLLTQLQKDEANLKKQVDDKNKAAIALNSQIEKIIAEEIKLAKEKAEKEAKATATKTGTPPPVKSLNMTPEETQLSKDFISNMGKLPWPVVKGFIVSKFGQHEHESLKNVYINNNGVDIKTESESAVRSIFGGTVVNSFYLPSTQNSVIIKHGEYFTVYSNLKTVSVTAGQKITTKQNIGIVYTQEDGSAKVHLEIWKGTVKTNPQLWLAQ